MNRRIRELIAFVLIIGLLISTPGVFAAAASPKLNKKAVTITIGNTVGLTVKNTTKKVKWSSSNKAVAKVDSDGDVTAKKAGKAKITAKVGKKKYTCKVTVPKQYISAKSALIEKGSKQRLSVYGVSSSDSLFWGSDYENIATVSQTGEITAKSIGKTTVYAVINNGNGKTYECDVVVYETNAAGDIITASPEPSMTPEPTKTPDNTGSSGTSVTKVTLSESSLRLAISEQKVLKANITPSSAVNQRVTWNSGNTGVAKVGSDGTVTGVSAGTTVVYAVTSDGGFAAVCTVTVSGVVLTPKPSATPAPSTTPKPATVSVNKVTLSSKSLQMKAGETYTLKATISPTDASNKTVTWKSGNEAVAKIDNTGKVTAVAAGTTVVFVTTTDGEYSAICTVTVTAGTATASPSVTPSATPTASPSATPSATPTASPSTTPSATPTASPSVTPSATPTATPTASPSATPTATPTASPSATPTATPSAVPTPVLNQTSLEIPVGQSYGLVVTGASGDVTWSSSDVNVAEVSQEGKITAKQAGSATITAAAADGKRVSCTVKVVENVAAKLTLSDNNTTVAGCTNPADATYIEIPTGVTKIADGAFKGLSKLWGISIPAGVVEIGESAFADCTNLRAISIPEGVTIIEEAVFSGCSALESVTLPDSIVSIKSKAFYGCSALKSIRIPDSVTEIASDAFGECDDVKISGSADSYAERWTKENGYEFVTDDTGD